MRNTPIFHEAGYRKALRSGVAHRWIAASFNVHPDTVKRHRRMLKREEATAQAPPAQVDEWTLPPASTTRATAKVDEVKPAPFAIGGKWKRFVVCSDVHGDKQDTEANAVMFRFVEEIWKPQVRICAGDVWDFRPLRRGANAEEKAESMQADYLAGQAWLRRFCEAEGEKYFCRGNHDERLFELAQYGNGVERDFASGKAGFIRDEIERMGVQMLPYDKRAGLLQIGHLKVLHGFHCGITAARQTALIYGSALFGHIHAIDEAAIPGLERRSARAIGCLCSLSMEYAARHPNTLRQAHGFAYGVLNPESGDYFVWQAERLGQTWVMPSDFVEMN